MKKIIILIVLIIPLVLSSAYSQNHCSYPLDNDENGIPDFNTELGSTIEIFDWTQEQYSAIYLNSDGTNSVEIFPRSPFHFDDQDRNIDHLKGPQIKDYHPEDGWELGKITTTQQEKIEELFLHLIEMEKRLKKLEKENYTLKINLEKSK